MEQQLKEEMGTSSTLRHQLEDERQRSAAAERRAGRLDRSISQFAEELEPILVETPLSGIPPVPTVIPDDQGGAGDGPGGAGPAKGEQAEGKAGGPDV